MFKSLKQFFITYLLLVVVNVVLLSGLIEIGVTNILLLISIVLFIDWCIIKCMMKE